MSEECDNENEAQKHSAQTLIPLEQQTLTFHGLPLVVVRLPDGRPGIILRWICENLGLAPTGQVTRIRRTEVIADDLVYVQVETSGGTQTMPTLVLTSVPYWLGTIDTKRMKDAQKRQEILYYQREVVAALYEWAATRHTKQAIVPAQPTQPARPAPDASAIEWADYYEQMALFYRWKNTVETRLEELTDWQSTVESRLEGVEEIARLVPEILNQLPPATITAKHQQQVKAWVAQLHDVTGKHQMTIYTDLYTAFSVPRYQELLEADWQKVEHWFQVQIEQGKQKKRR